MRTSLDIGVIWYHQAPPRVFLLRINFHPHSIFKNRLGISSSLWKINNSPSFIAHSEVIRRNLWLFARTILIWSWKLLLLSRNLIWWFLSCTPLSASADFPLNPALSRSSNLNLKWLKSTASFLAFSPPV